MAGTFITDRRHDWRRHSCIVSKVVLTSKTYAHFYDVEPQRRCVLKGVYGWQFLILIKILN